MIRRTLLVSGCISSLVLSTLHGKHTRTVGRNALTLTLKFLTPCCLPLRPRAMCIVFCRSNIGMMGAMSNDPAKLAHFAGFCEHRTPSYWMRT